MDSVELNVVTLEDGIDYVVFYILEFNKTNYLFLANKDNPEDVAIRKLVKNGEESTIERLDEDEFEKVLLEFDKLVERKEKKGNDEE
jgi:hypothetical protein